MASEREINSKNASVIVEHFSSPVVEAIALLSSYVNQDQHEFAKSFHEELALELSQESNRFIHTWTSETDWDFMELLNFLLPFPYFSNMEQFTQSISTLSNQEYLYHFLWEEVPLEHIEILLNNPSSIHSFDTHILWDTEKKRNFIEKLILNIDIVRKKITNLFLEITQSEVFQKSLHHHHEMYEKSISDVKKLKMEPLHLAQYVMGKTFRRTSLYKLYYFIPSYFLTPHRIRLFNSEVCFVIYGCAKPLSDARETSANLEIKLKALADRNRLLILSLLSGKKEYGAKLAEYIGITTATVSHHLEVLKKAGFVREEKVGNIKYFSSEISETEEFLNELQQFIIPKANRG